MIRKFDVATARELIFVKGSTDVLVFPGTILQMLPSVGLDPATYIVPVNPKLYGLCVREIPGWDITLIGMLEHVDAVANDEDWLFRAYLTAYPANCPECRQELVPVMINCGGDKNRTWQGACVCCGQLRLMLGRAILVPSAEPGVFQIVEADAKPEESWRDRKPLL